MLIFLILFSCLRSFEGNEKVFIPPVDASVGLANLAKELGITTALSPLFKILLSPISFPSEMLLKLAANTSTCVKTHLSDYEGQLLEALVKNDSHEKIKSILDKSEKSSKKIELNKKITLPDSATAYFLHLAITHSNVDTVVYLIQKGADPTVKDNLNRDALLLAIEFEKWQVIEFLLSPEKIKANIAGRESERTRTTMPKETSRNDGFFASSSCYFEEKYRYF